MTIAEFTAIVLECLEGVQFSSFDVSKKEGGYKLCCLLDDEDYLVNVIWDGNQWKAEHLGLLERASSYVDDRPEVAIEKTIRDFTSTEIA